ncbi:MAG: hypothetical protein P0116_02385 [Candidatus Nitrosocosmicus sp.]|nr:hypothetical protein [Candidatus Nitrosocosmicus sp.]
MKGSENYFTSKIILSSSVIVIFFIFVITFNLNNTSISNLALAQTESYSFLTTWGSQGSGDGQFEAKRCS